jgi:hypothetical protein
VAVALSKDKYATTGLYGTFEDEAELEYSILASGGGRGWYGTQKKKMFLLYSSCLEAVINKDFLALLATDRNDWNVAAVVDSSSVSASTISCFHESDKSVSERNRRPSVVVLKRGDGMNLILKRAQKSGWLS